MQIILLISQIAAIIILCAVAYVIILSTKAISVQKKSTKELMNDKAFMKIMREQISKHEPDELIESWQEGFAIGLKQFLLKKCNLLETSLGYAYYIKLIENDIDAINQLRVIEEMGLKFSIEQPDGNNMRYWICIIDVNTKCQWKMQPHDKVEEE